VLVVGPASWTTGSSQRTEESPSAKAGHSHLPLPISTQARRKILGIGQATVSAAAAARLLASTEVREVSASWPINLSPSVPIAPSNLGFSGWWTRLDELALRPSPG
jgi:hypothetical protein